MNETILTLQRLKQIRERAVSQLTTELARQKQLCQRYQNNIRALTTLNDESSANISANPVLMSNSSNYKSHIQKVIDWQKQEYALADKTAQTMQKDLVKQACREKTVDLVLQDQQAALKTEQDRHQQKMTDGLSAQAWLRNRLLGSS